MTVLKTNSDRQEIVNIRSVNDRVSFLSSNLESRKVQVQYIYKIQKNDTQLMPITIETDLKEILTKIDSRLERMETSQSELKESIVKIETTLQNQQTYIQKIPDLAEKVGELKNWKQIGLVIATALISSVLSGTIGGTIGWLIRGSKFNP